MSNIIDDTLLDDYYRDDPITNRNVRLTDLARGFDIEQPSTLAQPLTLDRLLKIYAYHLNISHVAHDGSIPDSAAYIDYLIDTHKYPKKIYKMINLDKNGTNGNPRDILHIINNNMNRVARLPIHFRKDEIKNTYHSLFELDLTKIKEEIRRATETYNMVSTDDAILRESIEKINKVSEQLGVFGNKFGTDKLGGMYPVLTSNNINKVDKNNKYILKYLKYKIKYLKLLMI
jgi:hypothetical protein